MATIDAALLAFGGLDLVVNNAGLSISKPLLDTTEADWDLQHDVMAKGSFLVAQAAARAMIDQHLGGDIVYICSKNAVFAGPNNIAYSAVKADQAHQVRLLAAELGEHGIRVNGVNPDGVVQGSGIFAGGWGAQRAAVYGVPEDQLGAVLRPAHAAQARGAARARRQRRHRHHLRRVQPHDGPADPGRRRCGRRLPALNRHAAPGLRRGRHRSVRRSRDGRRRGERHRVLAADPPLCATASSRPTAISVGPCTHCSTRCSPGSASWPAEFPEVESIGIDTWGVDYALLDDDGQLVDQPIAYRDDRTSAAIDVVHGIVEAADLYEINGQQFLPFNTVYQLVADRRSGRLDGAAHVVLLPDLLAFWLTGELRTEATNASTTGLLDARSGQWSNELLARLGLPRGLLLPLQQPGEVRGRVQEELRARLGLPASTVVTTVGSHDTASAVVAVSSRRPPLRLRLQWNVVAGRAGARRADHHRSQPGRQLHERGWRRPADTVPAQHVRSVAAAGIDAGLGRSGPSTGPDGAARRRRRVAGGRPADRRRRPGVHPARAGCRRASQRPPRRAAPRPPTTPPAVVRCIIDSLAASYATTIRRAAELAAARVDVVHIVGGGSQNALLCQLTADRTGHPVTAGPVEATALGNVLIQARAGGAVATSLDAIRRDLARVVDVTRYEPTVRERPGRGSRTS